MSKLGLHIISWANSQPILDFVGKAKPRVLKMIDFNDLDTDAVRRSSRDTLIIGRLFLDNQPLDNPAANARALFDQLQPAISKMGDRIDVWEGYNEIVPNSIDEAKRYNDFTVAWAALMHGQALKCAAYSFSTGQPDLQYWPYLVDGAQACDYLALHEYDWPRMDTHAGKACLRYRQSRAALPADAQRPILITECGIDDNQRRGWKTYATADDYISQLAWYDGELTQDDYVVGATIFTVDGKDWQDFDVLPILGRIADYIIAHPSPPSLGNVQFTPTTLNAGDLLTVSFTVTNNSSTTMQTQGPNPGFVYNEGDTFRTRGFPEVTNAFRLGVDFDGRTGIDHPYRWGLGTSLAPGQSANVTGAIRLTTARARNYWAGLVQEWVAWQQDNVGKQLITVNSMTPPGTQPVITNVTFTPTTLDSGALLNVSISVRNDSRATLPTQGPDPGFIYNEGEDFRSRGYAEQNGAVRVGVDFAGRNGIDHPYRWGLGAALASGQATVVSGQIRLNTAQARNYWAGLVREQVAWLQDNQGTQLITVTGSPPLPSPTGQVAITSVTFSPTRLAKGQLLQVHVTVENGTNAPLITQGPEPGFIYNEGDNFLTKNNPPIGGAFRIAVDFDGRTGVHHPYRWGLGTTLQPGQSVTVDGFIRLNRVQTINFWVGLIQEYVALIQDRQGVTAITVMRG